MRPFLKSASAFLFALSLALVVLAVAATDAMANPADCVKTFNNGEWECPPTAVCPENQHCGEYEVGSGWACKCQ